MARTNTGKASEKEIQAALKQFSDVPKFDFQRLYDATSARNAFVAQTGDFLLFTPYHHGVLEVKSTQHQTRLSKTAFSDLQRAKLHKREQAGGQVFVAVHHYTSGVWRLVPFSVCYEAFHVAQEASLITEPYPTFNNAQELINHLVAHMFGVPHE